jgi:endonuclease/exonuclease/phosphatase (EEP) superfamily protein YafD
VVLATAAVVLVLVAPGALGLADVSPFGQLVALRGLVGLVLLLAALLVLVALAARERRARPRRGLALALAGVLLAGAGAQGAVLAARGVGTDGPGDPDDADLVVLAFNTFGTVPADDLAALVLAQDADVAVLPETTAETARTAAGALTAAGRPTTALAADAAHPGSDGVALLLRTGLGDYDQVGAGLPATELGTFAAVLGPGGAAEPGAPDRVVATHLRAPSSGRRVPVWRAHTAAIADVCRSTPGVVVAGDLNATLDHPGLADLGPCVDAARAAGAAGLGTWPAGSPEVLGAPIDHVLVDGRAWRVAGFAVLPAVGASDHRPVVAHLDRR